MQVTWPFGRRSSNGCTLRTQYLTIGDTGAHAALLSCPTWIWGAEHGVNEYGVAIGNERVGTTHDAARAKPALTGMDLVRLGLERSRSAAEAVDVMIGLLESCGQGGITDAVHGEAYDSSFLVADPGEAFVLETAGTDYAVAPARGATRHLKPARASAPGGPGPPRRWPPATAFTQFRDAAEDTLQAEGRLRPAAAFSIRLLPAGSRHARPPPTCATMAPVPGEPRGSRESSSHPRRGSADELTGVTVCMHIRDLCVTAASMIAELPDALGDGAPLRVYVAPGSPCVSIYVPAFPLSSKGPPPFVPIELSGEELWHAADAVRRRVEADPDALPSVRAVLQPVEDEIWFEADEVLERPIAGLRSPARGAPAHAMRSRSCIP